jgi:hypothetical protein
MSNDEIPMSKGTIEPWVVIFGHDFVIWAWSFDISSMHGVRGVVAPACRPVKPKVTVRSRSNTLWGNVEWRNPNVEGKTELLAFDSRHFFDIWI